ncbi:MAG TPA: 30S ribosomal protein S11, partial [Verrucomicrobiota bacterium]|nr:30S ribosomal protein S11 [Verrucomicrobiota bacterium]
MADETKKKAAPKKETKSDTPAAETAAKTADETKAAKKVDAGAAVEAPKAETPAGVVAAGSAPTAAEL